MKPATFHGTFERGDVFWTYDFYLDDMSLIVNADGNVLLSCQEVVLEIHDETDRLSWLWKDDAKIKRTKGHGTDFISVKIKRHGRWRKAACFSKEKNEE